MDTIKVAYIGRGYVIDGRGIVEEIIYNEGMAEIIYHHGKTEVLPTESKLAVIGVTAEALNEDFLEDLWGDSPNVIVGTKMLKTFWITLPGAEF